jgi:hypothetical protein
MVVCRLASVPSRYPRFVDFSWSFPVNWYIQSILYTPQSSQSHSYLLRFSTSMRHCRLATQLQAFQYASTPHAKHLPLFITASYSSLRLPLLISLWCPRCRRNTTHLVHAMTCILPPSFFGQSRSFLSRVWENCTIHSYYFNPP